MASPFNGKIVLFKQADGSSVDVKLFGTEYYMRAEGLDGFTLSLHVENMTADLQFSGNSIFSGTIAVVQQSMERVAHLGPLIKPYL